MSDSPVRPLMISSFLAALLVPCGASAFQRAALPMDSGPYPLLSADCTLAAGNSCSGWAWVFNDVEGAVWGAVLDPDDCPGGCYLGGAVTEITLYGKCATVPGVMNGVGISLVDAAGCLVATLFDSGPVTITHCVFGDRWTVFPTPITGLDGNPFAVTIEWGPQTGGVSNPQFATDNGIANLYCSRGILGTFPGCWLTFETCPGWTIPPQNTFIYVTDFNGDGILDDACQLYGAPYPLSFPYVYPYGYLPNNLIVSVGLDCSSPVVVEPGTWGHVKSLFE